MELNNESPKTYTSFWPVLIVFACFTITNILNLIGNIETRSNLITNGNLLVQAYSKAQAKEGALNGLAQDLIALAPTSLIAQQIVNDFHIQLRNKAPGTSPASTPAPAAPAVGNTPPKQ